MTLDPLSLSLEAASKAIVYLALLLVLGASTVRWLILPRARELSGAEIEGCERRLGALGLSAALALLAGLALRLVAHTAAAFGIGEATSIESLRIIGLESRWGGGWRLQVLAALVAASAALLIRARPHAGWLALMGAAVACALALPLLGHAAGEPRRVAYHSMHVLGAGFWLGSLGSILVAGRPRAPLLRRFSPVALGSAALLALSGAGMAFEYVAAIPDLWRTAYGRTLVLKLALVGAIAACGYLNWRHWRAGEARDRPGGLETVEAALAAAVVLITAVLTELEHS